MSTQSARVRIHNNTSHSLLSVAVVHKYSDDFKNDYAWQNVKEKSHTGNDLKVQYNTGFLTTGQDWWLVTWALPNGKVYVTSPNNFRGIIDSIETLVSDNIASLVAKATTAAGQPELAPIASIITDQIKKLAVNEESTTGFKSFILRDEDENQTVTITINDNSVDYDVKSGDDKNNPIKEVKALQRA